MPLGELRSSKKLFLRNDVLISRLRPYLRQAAFVDSGFGAGIGDVDFACSTEFFVLRSLGKESIAFLVPYLLSASVQTVLSASQEGGHHPRFDETALMTLPIPESLLAKRLEISAAVLKSASLYRQYESTIANLIGEAEALGAKNSGRLF
jgi:hypothetical protein